MLRLSNLRLLSQERRQLLQRGHRRLEHVVELRELHDRLKHAVRVNHQRQQGTNLHGAAQHRITTQYQRTGNKHIAQKHQYRRVYAENLNRIHHRQAVTLRRLSVLDAHLSLRTKGLHRADTRKRLHKTARQVRRLRTHRTENWHRRPLEPARQKVNRHAHDQHEQTNTPIQQENSDRRNQHRQQRNRQLADAAVQEAADRINIAGQTRNDLARGVPLMERHAQRLRVTEHPLTQVHHHTQ